MNDKKEIQCKEGSLGQQGYMLHELGKGEMIQQLYIEEKENTFAAFVWRSKKMNELHNTGIIIGLSLIFLEVYNALFLSLPSSEVHS